MKKTLLTLSLSFLCLSSYAQESNQNNDSLKGISTQSYHCQDGKTTIDFKEKLITNSSTPLIYFDITLSRLKDNLHGEKQKQDIHQISLNTPLGIPTIFSTMKTTSYSLENIKEGETILLHPVLDPDRKVSVTLCYNQIHENNSSTFSNHGMSLELPNLHESSLIEHFSFDDKSSVIFNLNDYQLEIKSRKVNRDNQ